jgi:hypothetical protein
MERGQLHSRGPAEMLGGVARSVIGRDGFDPQSVGHPRRPPERPCGSPTPSARQAGSVESETLTYILRLSFYVLMYSSTRQGAEPLEIPEGKRTPISSGVIPRSHGGPP